MSHARIPLVIGPTASGKSALALEWAAHHGGEILSADSRQVYRHLDIGTAKPSPAERARVRHHFVDERSPDEPFTAARFAEEAEDRLDAIIGSGATPVVVGGSTLYVQALAHGFSPVPDVPEQVRLDLMDELARNGLELLVEELRIVDPLLFERTDLSNPHRVVRALEVFRHTGRPLSSFHGSRRTPRHRYAALLLWPAREALHERIDRRVDEMMEAGLLAEVERLLERGFSPALQPLRSIGYAELIAHLRGDRSLGEAVADIKTNTRRYAKRQMTFFGKYFADARRLDPALAAPAGADLTDLLAATGG